MWKHRNTHIIWNFYKTMCSTSTGSNLMFRFKNPILKITNPHATSLKSWAPNNNNNKMRIYLDRELLNWTHNGHRLYLHAWSKVYSHLQVSSLEQPKWPKIWNLHFQNLHYLATSFIGSISFVSSQCMNLELFFNQKNLYIYS